MKPNEIIASLSESDRELLNAVLGIEKKRLHNREIKNNSRIEKEIIAEIMGAVDKVVSDEN